MQKIEAIKDKKNICVKCLKEKQDVKEYILTERGYGSMMDGCATKFQFCDDCKPNDLESILNETPIMEEYLETYMREKDLMAIIYSLPINGRELVLNRWTNGQFADAKMKPNDWIQIESNQAPDSLYKEYGMYSPSEIKATEENFPTCENVFNVVYNDGSKCSKCVLNVHGAYNQKKPDYNDKCLNCQLYEPRKTKIKTLTDKEFEKIKKV